MSSLEKPKEFYVEKLGLEVLDEIPGLHLISLRAGGVRISIFGGFQAKSPNAKNQAGTHLVFRTEDIEKTVEELKSKSVVFKGGITEAPGFVKFAETTVFDGNVIEFGQYLRDPLQKP